MKVGDRVAGLLPRTPDLLTVLLGTLRAGAVYQPLFTAFGPRAIEARLTASLPSLVVTDTANRDKLDGIGHFPILVSGASDPEESLNLALVDQDMVATSASLQDTDPLLMMYTSGTTGSPKGLPVSLKMLRATEAYMRIGLDLRPDEPFWNMADPGWAYGLYYGCLGPLILGQAVTLVEGRFSVSLAYDVIREFGIRNLTGSPTAYRQMAASSLQPPAGIRLISSAGETLDTGTWSWLERAFGCPVHDHFGQTEIGMVLCQAPEPDHSRRASMGVALPGYKVAVIRPDGSEAGEGEPGLLAVDRRSPLFWFQGYCGDPVQSFIGDYYVTGDLAIRNSTGDFQFVGREDDVITSSGYRIGPTEVEQTLLQHPAITDAAVIGRPDEQRTETICAYVVLATDYTASGALRDELTQFVKHRLAAHAYPREINFIESLPRTPIGKLQRLILKTAPHTLAETKEPI